MAKNPKPLDACAVRYDGPLRFMVSSRRGNPPYLCDLASYAGNGRCCCKDFTCRKEPLLREGVTPEQAVKRELAIVPEWGTAADALRCYHIHVARLKFADDVVSAILQQHGRDKTKASDGA